MEIDRYDFGSDESKSAFFRIGVMYADFILDGTTPWSRDQQNNQHKNGASTLSLLLSNHVGRRSDKHCLSGRASTISMISVYVTGVETELTPDRGWSEPRFISARSSCPNTGNYVVEELVDRRYINVR